MSTPAPPRPSDGGPPSALSAPPAVARTGYQGFGSFHSGNLEQMAADPEWLPPPNVCEQDCGALAAAGFGAACRPHFLLDLDAWTFVNAGAFGSVLRVAQQEADAWRARCESQPLRFLDRELFPQLLRVTRELAAFVGADPAELALLPNATTGLSTVISSLRGRAGPGDVLFSLDVGYGSVKRMLAVAAQQTGASLVELPLRLPLASGDDVVRQVAAALPPRTRLAVFDAVTSNTAIRLPLERLVALCRERAPGCEVLVDGAHALGMLPLDLRALGADYFVANCHKWLGGARGSALLHVQRRHQRHVRPLVVSHGYGSGWLSEFAWDGCRDYAPLLAVSAALRVWRALGADRVRAYQRDLLRQATELLAAAWSTGTLVPLDLCGAMALVRLPSGCLAAARTAAAPDDRSTGDGAAATSADAKWVQDCLHFHHAIECPVKCVGGELWVRISAHVYNAAADYERLAAAVLGIAAGAAC